MRGVHLIGGLIIGLLVSSGWAALPPELPGSEITEFESSKTTLVTPTIPDKIPHADEAETWSAPGIETQLNQAEKLIGMGMGALFVPRMTEAQLEPEVSVITRRGKSVIDGQVGEKISLEPGSYIVLVGSGSDRQRAHIEVDIQEGRTAVIKPTWSGLVVETRTSEGELNNESYEILRLNDGESFGRGMGQPQERIKDLPTWILPPGLYRLMRVGEDAGSLANYITVQLNAGELTRVELVYDQTTGDLIAGGVRPPTRKTNTQSPWTFGARLGGSVSLGATVAEGERQNDYWSVLTDLRLLARFDHMQYYGYTEMRSRNSFQWIAEKDQDAELFITTDAIQFQSSWMRRLRQWLGPYARVSAWSHMLKHDFTHPDDSVMLVVDRETEQVLQTINPGTALRIQPVAFPFRLGEGLGASLHFAMGTSIELQAQTGMAWRQTWTRDVLVSINDDQTRFAAGVDQFIWGNENQLIMRFHFGSSLSLDIVGEVFLPEFDPDRFQIEELSLDLRLALTRHIEISYQQELFDRNASGLIIEGEPRFESRNTVQLRFFFNY